MKVQRLAFFTLVAAGLAACADVPAPTASLQVAAADANGVQAMANGSGQYTIPLPASLGGGFAVFDFEFATIVGADGASRGNFRHFSTIQGMAVDFSGEVTCASVNAELGRAWIGGVVTENNSTHPSFQTAVQQAGRDAWFRVADRGNGGSGDADRASFVGFEGGAGIITSAQYCADRIWPNESNGVVSGNLIVR